jgi:hypothetical protein
VKPASSASCALSGSVFSEYPSQPADVVYAGKPSASRIASRSAFVLSLRRRISSASSRVSASSM